MATPEAPEYLTVDFPNMRPVFQFRNYNYAVGDAAAAIRDRTDVLAAAVLRWDGHDVTVVHVERRKP